MKEWAISTLEDLLSRLSTDLLATGLSLNAGVFDLMDGIWIAGPSGEKPHGFGSDGYVLAIPGRQQLMPSGEDGEPDVLAIIGAVQEWAMDELGHGWPELCDDLGSFVALLEPDHDRTGYVWSAQGSARAPIGQLASLQVGGPPVAR